MSFHAGQQPFKYRVNKPQMFRQVLVHTQIPYKTNRIESILFSYRF